MLEAGAVSTTFWVIVAVLVGFGVLIGMAVKH